MSRLAAVLAYAPSSGHSGGSKSPVILLIVGLVFIAIGGLQGANPRLLWRLGKWQYKNPEANEPSDKGFLAWRIGGIVVAIVGIVLVILAITKF